MAPVYADHPFKLIPDPRPEGEKTQNDMFDDVATEMTCVHNCFIRGINAVCLQAPYVKPAETKAFLNYAQLWSKMLHMHHKEEEAIFFPGVEKIAGEEGIMAANVEQHHAFHEGLERYEAYIQACLENKEQFNGKVLVEIIDTFGAILTQHLTEEITTLMDLRKYGTEQFKDYPAMASQLAEQALKNAGTTTGIIFVVTCLDVHFEGGRWSNFPPIPWIINMMFRYIHFWVHSDWWKFGPCDRLGNLRPLYAVPKE
ncbi:hypothetical protein SEUCBS140593_001005 [Sporothrix eucalyptigena]|uniref:Hemerythrin-like domain-containing protein n=1 Tax=Sporothrix eucalyptigena TaxID=1812306 RepID=A0ABP0AUK6_9PEZI